MSLFRQRGVQLRDAAKQLVIDYMKATPVCSVNSEGLKQSVIFRECGLDWGSYPKTTSSHQQYWVAGLLQELAIEGIVERVGDSGPWRLKLPS